MGQVIGGTPFRHTARAKAIAKAKPAKPKPTYGFMNGPGKTGPLTYDMRDHGLERALAKAKLPPGTPGADIKWIPADRRPHW